MSIEGFIEKIEETLVQVKVVNILVKKAYSVFNLHPSRLRAAQKRLLKILELDDSSIFEKARNAMFSNTQEVTLITNESPLFSRKSFQSLETTHAPLQSPYLPSRRSNGNGSQCSVLDRRMSRGRVIPQQPFSIRNTSSGDHHDQELEGEVDHLFVDLIVWNTWQRLSSVPRRTCSFCSS